MAHASESPHLALLCGCQHTFRGTAGLADPCVHPWHVFHRIETEFLDPFPHGRIDRLQKPVNVQHRDAIRAALDHPCIEFLRVPQPLFGPAVLTQPTPHQHQRVAEQGQAGHASEHCRHAGHLRLVVLRQLPDRDGRHCHKNGEDGRETGVNFLFQSAMHSGWK